MNPFQSDLSLISSWLSSHHLYLNLSKCKYMLFSHKPSSWLPSLAPLVLAGSPIELVSTFKYLGVLLTPLSWSTHISYLLSSLKNPRYHLPALLQILLSYHSQSPIHLSRSPYSRVLCPCVEPLFSISHSFSRVHSTLCTENRF